MTSETLKKDQNTRINKIFVRFFSRSLDFCCFQHTLTERSIMIKGPFTGLNLSNTEIILTQP